LSSMGRLLAHRCLVEPLHHSISQRSEFATGNVSCAVYPLPSSLSSCHVIGTPTFVQRLTSCIRSSHSQACRAAHFGLVLLQRYFAKLKGDLAPGNRAFQTQETWGQGPAPAVSFKVSCQDLH
jgi:hypothetical protein